MTANPGPVVAAVVAVPLLLVVVAIEIRRVVIVRGHRLVQLVLVIVVVVLVLAGIRPVDGAQAW